MIKQSADGRRSWIGHLVWGSRDWRREWGRWPHVSFGMPVWVEVKWRGRFVGLYR